MPGNARTKERGRNRLKSDAFKVCHHGSKFNNSRTLFETLDCPRWLLSTNGDKFHQPDRETIARILFSRKAVDTDLYFNHRSEYNEVWDAGKIQKEWRCEARYPKSPSGGITVEL